MNDMWCDFCGDKPKECTITLIYKNGYQKEVEICKHCKSLTPNILEENEENNIDDIFGF